MTKLVATGVQFPDATIQTTALSDIGVGQTWQAMGASRVSGTVYTNSTGKSISVAITTQGTGYITVGTATPAVSTINNATNHLNTVVPNGATYFMTGAAYNWAELRS